MIIIKHIKKLEELLNLNKIKDKKVGFVPTMGALHNGHISLIKKAVSENDITVCSIFINAIQFTNVVDYAVYPVTLDTDVDKLEKACCDILFLPSVEEMYPASQKNQQYNLGNLETILEGKFRPGHFQGVCIIVDKLLQAVKPNELYIGRKDYQQCMVISKMIIDKKYDIKVNICETIREDDGLAMSSRNLRLNNIERKQALRIIESLNFIKDNIKPGDLSELKKDATKFLEKSGYNVDYTEIADASTLEIVKFWDGQRKLVALVAAFLNEVRLIDNIIL